MKKRRIFFFDVDGTLYDSLNKQVHPSTLSALKTLHKQDDTVIAVATGRAFYMLDIIESLKPYIDVYITINGRIIYNKNTIIYDSPMPSEDIVRFKRQFMDQTLNFGFIGKHKQAIHTMDDYARSMFEKASLPCPTEDPLFNLEHDVYQMWAFGPEEVMKAFENSHEDYDVVPWLKDGFDIIHKDTHKGSGVMRVLKALAFAPEDAYAFGDADNDIPMFKVIKNSVAMGNATKNLKRHASMVTASEDERGIEDALRRLKFIK
ncbi:MAG: Cof-type HAD-IIB family hydrolase [Bacillota bacterium]